MNNITDSKEIMKRLSILVCASLLSVGTNAQQLITETPVVDKAFTLAANTLYKNTPDSLIKAGGQYGGEWTRDVSINAWNAASLLMPEKTAYSLWSVTTDNRKMIGHQYWDQIIWVIAAYDFYQKNNDLDFLKQAYTASANTMEKLEQEVYDEKYGLFTGPSVFNDGIAGYEEPIFDPANKSCFVLDHPGSKVIKCLSTNCVYFKAYELLAEMAQVLGDKGNVKVYRKKASLLKENIRKNLYDKKQNRLNYLIDGNGKVHPYQEGLGISLAILFQVVTPQEAGKVIDGVYMGRYGLPSVYPAFKRFSKEHPGRHNQIVWPFVNAFWADACIRNGRKDIFMREFLNLADLAINKSNNCFYEIYNEDTGKVDGGWQQGSQWHSVYDQTWSATGYMRMVLNGLLGMSFSTSGLTFAPDFALMKDLGFKELKDLRYQQGTLDLKMVGTGDRLSAMLVNGEKHNIKKPVVAGAGKTTIEFVMAD